MPGNQKLKILFVFLVLSKNGRIWHGIKTEKLQVSGVVGAFDGLLNLNETFQRYQSKGKNSI